MNPSPLRSKTLSPPIPKFSKLRLGFSLSPPLRRQWRARSRALLLRPQGEPQGEVPQVLREDLRHQVHHHRPRRRDCLVPRPLRVLHRRLLRGRRRRRLLHQGAQARHQGVLLRCWSEQERPIFEGFRSICPQEP